MTTSTRYRSELPACDGSAPPECCTPMSPAERVAAMEQSMAAVSPRWCPQCGSRWVAPLFRLDFLGYDCFECRRVFCAGD